MHQLKISTEYLKDYIALRNEIDQKCNKLWSLHHTHMKCNEGCSFCCQAFRIFPIEFHAIRDSLTGQDLAVNNKHTREQCKFLIENKCSIYENRPIICRTHGYPLIRLNEEAGAYEVSFCELNFTGFKLEKFKQNNVFQEDKYNSKLFMLNKKFIQQFPKNDYDTIQLIELNDLDVNILI